MTNSNNVEILTQISYELNISLSYMFDYANNIKLRERLLNG